MNRSMIFAAVCLALAVCALGFSYYIFRVAFYVPPNHHPSPGDPLKGRQYLAAAEDISRLTQIMQCIPYEDVTIPAFDGIPLHGRYYHLRDGAPLELLCHGYRSSAFRDCCGGHALARKMGFNTLVIDERAHGESGGSVITFGVKERLDVKSWLEYARGRFGDNVPFILSGLSMGAATVLMASELALPDSVAAILADSPYSSPAAIIEKVCADRHYPAKLFRPFLYLSAAVFGGFHLDGCSAKEAVRRAKVPILLIHGESDRFVPCRMSREIAACCASHVEVQTFAGAGHGLSYIVDPVRYERVVYNFLNSVPAIAPFISREFAVQLQEPPA